MPGFGPGHVAHDLGRFRRRCGALAAGLLAGAALAAAPAGAISVGVELLVGIDTQPCPQPSCTAFGGADAASNVPLDLFLAGGEMLDVFVLIDFGLPIRQYVTQVDVNPIDLVFQSATDISTLGFSTAADPNTTLSDGTPETGDADSNLCAPGLCTAPSTNTLYKLSFLVAPGFSADSLRDLTVSVESIDFDREEDDLDALRDTASLRLQAVPEPASALLLALGLAAMAGRRRTGAL